MLPSGAAGKRYVEEVIRLLKLWIQDTLLKSISLKAVHVIPELLLDKPSKSSKAKDHLQALERRVTLWDKGNIEGLLYESMAIQQRLRSDKEVMAIAKISLTLNVPCISEICFGIKIKLNFYFYTSLWSLAYNDMDESVKMKASMLAKGGC